MKPRYKSDVSSSIVVVKCGSRQGTAFFISDRLLMTARHNLVENINNKSNEEIWIETNDKRFLCELTEFGKDDKIDVSIIKCCDAKGYSDCYIKLLSLPFKKEELFVEGYPSEFGDSGNPYHFEVSSVKDVVGREYDVICSPARPTDILSYKGLSGSPILNSLGSAVGVMTDQMNRVLGYRSIISISSILIKSDVPFSSNWGKEDFTQYGSGKATDFLEIQLDRAGNRFSKGWQQEDVSLDTFLENFSSKQYIDLLKSRLVKIEEYYIYLRDDYSEDDGKNKGLSSIKITDEEKEKGIEEYVKGDYTSLPYYLHLAKEKVEENRDVEWITRTLQTSIVECREILDSLPEINKKFLLIQGKAGFGKTHRLCYFSKYHSSLCNVYLIFGGQIENGVGGVVEQICNICGFDAMGFGDLDAYMKQLNTYAIIIVDAINEGAGVSFWKENLDSLIEEVDRCSNVKLIISVREPFNIREFCGSNPMRFAIKQAMGFADPEAAAKHFFGENSIDEKYIHQFIQDFRSPLFLKVFCEGFVNIPYRYKDQVNKLWLYLLYIKKKNSDVSSKVDEDPGLNVTGLFLNKIANYSLFYRYCNDIEKHIARRYGDSICRGRFWKQSLLRVCLEENLLVEQYRRGVNETLIGFDYEEMGDFLRAYMLFVSKMDSEAVVNWLCSQDDYIQRNKLDGRKFANMIGAFLSIKDPKSEILQFPAFNNGKLTKYLLNALQYKNGARNAEILKILIQSGNSDYVDYLVEGFNEYGIEIIEILHEELMKLEISRRDLLWTSKVNEAYDLYGKEYFWDGRVDIVTEEDEKKASIIMTWMLCSSYPEARAVLKRKLVSRILKRPDLAMFLLNMFLDCSDDYVTEGLLCAIYGYLLQSRDIKVLSEVAEKVYSTYYSDDSATPENLLIRQWSLKILEFDKHLNNSSYFDKSRPPYAFDGEAFDGYIQNENIKDQKDFFGTTEGSQLLHESLTGFSDFNRYIIGTNSFSESGVFIDKTTHKAIQLSVIENLICHKVKDLGWNDELGVIDNGRYSISRHDNKKERIGKKYQWISFYRVMGQLTDWCDMKKDRFSDDSEIHTINYPWYSDEQSYFDPSLTNIRRENIDIIIKPVSQLRIDEAKAESWIMDDNILPETNLVFVDNKQREWILLMGYDSVETEVAGVTKEFFLYYNSAFVKREDSSSISKWAEKKNFHGRWMPERTGSIDFLWNEYPWSDSFQNLYDEEWMTPGSGGCPSKIMLSYVAQLQENMMGLNSDDGIASTVYMPCKDIMDRLELYTAERGVVRSKIDNSIVAINANIAGYNHSGVLILKKELDRYMSDTDLVLFYFILGEKMLSYKNTSVPGSITDLSMCQKYEKEMFSEIQPLHVERYDRNKKRG